MATSSTALPLPSFMQQQLDLDQPQQLRLNQNSPVVVELHIVEDEMTTDEQAQQAMVEEGLQQEIPVNEDSIFNEFIPEQERAEQTLHPEVAVEDDHAKMLSIDDKMNHDIVKPVTPISHASRRVKRATLVVVKPAISRKSKKVKRSTVGNAHKKRTNKTKRSLNKKTKRSPTPSAIVEPTPVVEGPTKSVFETGPTQTPEVVNKLPQVRFIAYEHIAHETLAHFV
ncbi:hypothetical protein OIO90_005645 [Microbotryomycetes sp. JL221]|nr:hypothetical protein OIO90_005645 [Microbotryomycetes sp. JL221]